LSRGELEGFKKPPISAFTLLHTKALERDASKESIGIVSAKDLPLQIGESKLSRQFQKNKDLPTLADARMQRKNCRTERIDFPEEEKEVIRENLEIEEQSMNMIMITPQKSREDGNRLTMFGDFSNMSKVSVDFNHLFSHDQEKIFTFAGHYNSALESIESFKVSEKCSDSCWTLESCNLING
jgi:hypothetical protein